MLSLTRSEITSIRGATIHIIPSTLTINSHFALIKTSAINFPYQLSTYLEFQTLASLTAPPPTNLSKLALAIKAYRKSQTRLDRSSHHRTTHIRYAYRGIHDIRLKVENNRNLIELT